MEQQELIEHYIKVPSMTDPNVSYEIDVKHKTCSCPAYKKGITRPCKHLIEHGIVKKKVILYPTHPEYSQAMSAYVKSVRLRQTEDAIYWLIYLYTNLQDKLFRTRRRVWIAAAEDCQNVWVQKYATDWFSNKKVGYDKDLYGALKVTYMICQTLNWYQDRTAHHYIHSWVLADRLCRKWKKEEFVKDMSNVRSLLENSIQDGNGPKAIAFASILAGQPPKDKATTTEMLLKMTEKGGDDLVVARRVLNMYNCNGGKDVNYLGQAVYRMTCGDFGQSGVVSIDDGFLSNLISKAEKRWQKPKPVPKHYCDGLHCAGEDRRFSGMSIDMWKAINAYTYYGRLHPADKWLPQFGKT